ncbi:hypothetical protein [Streptomyces sp. NPDC048002]|uniref:hypothetical protein n=1 Tax=Streptomyces sp. NPDC048002 TaxID=3154344 RepID=UPI0033DF09FA
MYGTHGHPPQGAATLTNANLEMRVGIRLGYTHAAADHRDESGLVRDGLNSSRHPSDEPSAGRDSK